ncbi:MAG: protein-glutamate O-methyltransferase CheR [bacterium]|nr:protein-glutamate O-methyltransferase CheR [bacterium]
MYKEIEDLSEEQFARFAKLVYDRTNITLKEHKITLLSNRLRKRLRALELDDFDDYYRLLTGDAAGDEQLHFLEAVTTNETYFWRTTHNFDMLREDILPELVKEFRGEKLQLWSAGCSSGEEPYNIAIELTEGMKKSGVFSFQILATDISRHVVEFARAGRYSGRKIEKIPQPILHRYFRPVAERAGYFVVRDDIKEKIEFRLQNLFEEAGEAGRFHCIFCRNVMIYFDRKDQEQLVQRFFDALRPGGFLIVGHSESLFMMNTPFEFRHLPHGVAYFRPRSDGAPRDA